MADNIPGATSPLDNRNNTFRLHVIMQLCYFSVCLRLIIWHTRRTLPYYSVQCAFIITKLMECPNFQMTTTARRWSNQQGTKEGRVSGNLQHTSRTSSSWMGSHDQCHDISLYGQQSNGLTNVLNQKRLHPQRKEQYSSVSKFRIIRSFVITEPFHFFLSLSLFINPIFRSLIRSYCPKIGNLAQVT